MSKKLKMNDNNFGLGDVVLKFGNKRGIEYEILEFGEYGVICRSSFQDKGRLIVIKYGDEVYEPDNKKVDNKIRMISAMSVGDVVELVGYQADHEILEICKKGVLTRCLSNGKTGGWCIDQEVYLVSKGKSKTTTTTVWKINLRYRSTDDYVALIKLMFKTQNEAEASMNRIDASIRKSLTNVSVFFPNLYMNENYRLRAFTVLSSKIVSAELCQVEV